jgi:hypothetical protein
MEDGLRLEKLVQRGIKKKINKKESKNSDK